MFFNALFNLTKFIQYDQKDPTQVSCRGKRDPLYRQKRPITWTEATLDTDEALCRGERDILYRQKRPIVET